MCMATHHPRVLRDRGDSQDAGWQTFKRLLSAYRPPMILFLGKTGWCNANGSLYPSGLLITMMMAFGNASGCFTNTFTIPGFHQSVLHGSYPGLTGQTGIPPHLFAFGNNLRTACYLGIKPQQGGGSHHILGLAFGNTFFDIKHQFSKSSLRAILSTQVAPTAHAPTTVTFIADNL